MKLGIILYIILALFLSLVIGLAVKSQDAPEGCDLAALAEQMNSVAAELDGLALDEALVSLREVEHAISRARAVCSGYAFNSEDEGMQPVIGPLDFQAGTWIVTYTSTDFGIIELNTLDGDCGSRRDEVTLISVMAGEADKGAQQIFKPSGHCSALIKISNVSDGWTLEFTLVKAG